MLGDCTLEVGALGEEEGVDGLAERVDVGGNDDPCKGDAYTMCLVCST